jgi:broad specificity phosphatase PhoE
MRLFVLSRHAESVLNFERRVNGDPSLPVPLTEKGVDEARSFGVQVAHLPLDACLYTAFDRTKRTAEIAMQDRPVPLIEERLFNDVDVGELEGQLIDDYRAWKQRHARKDRFPGGESLDEAAQRYAAGLRRLLSSDWRTVLVVCHEIPVRYALNGASGSNDLDGPVHDVKNTTPYLFDEPALDRAAARIDELAARVATGQRVDRSSQTERGQSPHS